jgi:hygromycin-B 4-O-kinase
LVSFCYDWIMKTSLSQDEIKSLLSKEMGAITNLEQMVEGEESQALSFLHKNKPYVVRINPDIEGFKKDQYAYKHFGSDKIPIPRVLKLGHVDSNHSYCISELISGVTLQDADSAQITRLLEPLTDVWSEIGKIDISNTSGYGEFDENGNGKYETWQDFTLAVLDYDWDSVVEVIDTELVEKIKDELKRLVSLCPNDRKLVHGDFGANNVIVKAKQIKSVIDWENALYGDPLYDIAIAYFWSPWLVCMQKSAEYWEELLNGTDDYRARIRCYQLRIALHEIYDNATDGDVKVVAWLQKRTSDILSN